MAGLAREIADLSTRLTKLEAAFGDLNRGRDAGPVAAIQPSRPLPKPLRVLRKRLRTAGFWPSRKGQPSPASAAADSVLVAARSQAPARIRPFFDQLSPYQAWIENNRLTSTTRFELEALLADTPSLPRISVITPVHNTPAPFLRAMFESVKAQIYGDWELCLADDASTSAVTRKVLDEFVASDARIQMVRLETNGGISAATNAAVAMATGDILLFLDHDDLITPDCLAHFALLYAGDPTLDIAYSDDDKVSEDGDRYAPQFKPDWSPTLLLSFMYMSHALTVRRTLFTDLGGFLSEYDGSQDYEFALRATERARNVGHIPRVLYHWRAAQGSTARSGSAKPHSFEAGRKAVQAALDRRGIEAVAVHPDWALRTSVGMFTLEFPDVGPRVTIIVPTWNKPELLRRCIDSLEATTYADYDVLVIDNGSDDPTALALLSELSSRPKHRVVRIPRRAGGFNFAALMNEAVSHARSEYVLFLNNDTEVRSPGWLSQMVGYAKMPGVGAVGARLYFEDGTIQHAGIVHGYNDGLVGHAFRHAPPHDWGYMGFLRTSREYSAVTAACMLTPRKLFREMKGFDETAFAVAYNDVDYGFRLAERGYRSVYAANAELFHFEGKTRGYSDNPLEPANLRTRYRDWLDPYFNPNLSLDSEDFRPSTRRLPGPRTRPVRVVAVTHNLNLEGAPNTLFDLVVGLKAAGVIDPVVLSPQDGPLRDQYLEHGVEVQIFSAPSLNDYIDFDSGLDRISDTYRKVGAEVVIANTLPMFFAVNAARRAGLGAIWAQHESEPWESYFDYTAPEVRAHAYAAFGQTYRVTYVADATRRAWAPVQSRHTAQTIRHGVPPWRLAEETGRWTRETARAALGVEPQEKVLTLAGTICRRKGQLDLAQALADPRMSTLGPVRTFMAGARPEADYAADLADAVHALPPALSHRTVITGGVEDMGVYFAAADIVVCTSRLESAPRVIVEAMAFRRPIVTTPVFGVPELVDENVNAVFYQPGDVAALARRLAELLLDDERRTRMGDLGPAVLASRPGFAEMIDDYAQLIREAAEFAPSAREGRL